MLKYGDDIDRLAESAIRVEHFVNKELIQARSEDAAAKVKAWMVVNDFDVAPLIDTSHCSFIKREDVLALGSQDAVGAAAQRVPPEQLVARDVPLSTALGILHKRGWFFVSQGGEIEGIVTRHDLARPAVSLYLFARILSLEHGLRRLLGTYTNTPIPDAPPAEPDSSDPGSLASVVNRVGKVDELRRALGLTVRRAFKDATGFIAELRNHLAHGRSILNVEENARSAVERIRGLDALHLQVSKLVEEREQVWRTLAATHIVKRRVTETIWSGPEAVSLPLGSPLHVITACNPFERVLSAAENAKRNESLGELLAARPLEVIPVLARSPDGRREQGSFAVYGLSRIEACELARQFGQRAVFELDEQEFRVVTPAGDVRECRPRNS